LDNLDGLEVPLERARTLLCLGVTRRRAHRKRAAREALEQAGAIFEESTARPWADKARAELARIAGRRPSSNEVTETEHRVAELAAAGRSNKEIAAELFMGLSTVEAHLSRAYRKLGTPLAHLAGVGAGESEGNGALNRGISLIRAPDPRLDDRLQGRPSAGRSP
jgi:DNA-binding CsgD family transcriptional regulator